MGAGAHRVTQRGHALGGRQVATGMTAARDLDRRLRIGVYDLYWQTLGGGEQVDGSIAQVLARDHDVTLLGPQTPDVDATRRRLGVDLSACVYRKVVDDAEAGEASAEFDLFVNGTYLSKALNRAPVGYYYVHFPGEVPTRGDHLRSRLGVVGVKALSLAPRLPQRLTEVQAAFDRRVERGRVRADLHPLPRELAVHGLVGRAALGTTDRCALPAGAALRAARREGAADPRARSVLRPLVRAQQEAARTAGNVPVTAPRRQAAGMAHGHRRWMRRHEP